MDLKLSFNYGFCHLVRLIDGIKCRLPRKLRRRIVLERYFYDGTDVIADYDLFGRYCKASYLTPFLDENLLVDRYFRFGRAKRYWYTQDGLGSVRQLVSDRGRVLNSYTYTSWGVRLNWRERVSNRYTFTGREYNAETNLCYYRFRWYSPSIGCFTSRDLDQYLGEQVFPRFVGTKTRWEQPYVYVRNRPTVSIDPFGLRKIDVSGKVGLVVGVRGKVWKGRVLVAHVPEYRYREKILWKRAKPNPAVRVDITGFELPAEYKSRKGRKFGYTWQMDIQAGLWGVLEWWYTKAALPKGVEIKIEAKLIRATVRVLAEYVWSPLWYPDIEDITHDFLARKRSLTLLPKVTEKGWSLLEEGEVKVTSSKTYKEDFGGNKFQFTLYPKILIRWRAFCRGKKK